MNGENKISFDNIQRVPFDKFENDFSFIINQKIYNTNKFVASILSPKISRLLQENMNISYFRINTEFEGDFNQLIQYGEMKEINIKEEENQYFRSIMKELGNINEFLRFSKELQDDISYENVFKRIQLKTELHSNFDEEITFISSNFHDFCDKYPKEIFDLDANIIEQIISNNKLKILNEKELFDIVLTFYIKSKEYSILFSYINFLNLPRKCIEEFKEKFDINDLNISIWENICSRLEQDISNESIKAYRNSDQEIVNDRDIVIDPKKVVIIGSSGVGKTAILKRLVEDTFSTDSQSTIGVEFDSTMIDVDGQQVKLQIWDTAGQERFRSIAKAYFRNAVGVILVFDITERKTFDDVNMWLNDVHSLCDPTAVVLLIGNKSDLSTNRVVTLEEAEQFAQSHQIDYLEISDKDSFSVREAFVKLATQIIRKV